MARFEDITGREVLLKASGLKSGRILDVGMGSCACMSLFLATLGFEVTGVDRSPHVIHVARQKGARKRLKGSFMARRADATSLPFGKGVFDAVISFHSLHHMDNPVPAIREMFRVCRPGGMVLVADLNETGRKVYKHKADPGSRLLRSIERVSKSKSTGVRIVDTRMDRLFICQNKDSGSMEAVEKLKTTEVNKK